MESRIELSQKDLRILSKPFGRSKHVFSKKRGKGGKSISRRSLRPGEQPADIAWTPTLLNALLRRRRTGHGLQGAVSKPGDSTSPTGIPGSSGLPVSARFPVSTGLPGPSGLSGIEAEKSLLIRPEDLQIHVRKRQIRIFVLFVIDSSDSMGARRRLAVAKAAVMALLRRAYQHRHEVAVISFGGDRADLLLRPTSSVTLARRAMLRLEPDGATPMAAGVSLALRVLNMAASRGTYDTKIVILLSDGEANVPLHSRKDPQGELEVLMPRLAGLADSSIFVDTKRPVPGRRSEMDRLAEAARGHYYRPEELTAGTVIRAVSRAEK